jgi:putative peptidoglycan lipid II flippase
LRKIALQVLAALIMGIVLWWLVRELGWAFAGSGFDRAWSLSALVAVGGISYFGVAYLIGGVDRSEINLLLRRGRSAPKKS